MSENLNSAPHTTRETHRHREGASVAKQVAKPLQVQPRSLSKKHASNGVSPAAVEAKTNERSRGANSEKRDRKITRAARFKSQTVPQAPPTPSKKHSRKAVSPAALPMKPVNSEGHPPVDNQKLDALEGRANARAKPKKAQPDHSLRDGHNVAVAGDDRFLREPQNGSVIATIQELWRRRQSWHRAEKSLTLQAKAICRRYVGGDKGEADKLFATVDGQKCADSQHNGAVTVAILPLMMARETVEKHRTAVEKELAKLAKSLPIYKWIEPIPGIAAGSLAALVGECGDIGSYKSASALWKRMGLAVIQGGRQRRVAGVDALEHGYSPQRRSVMWNIGGGLIGGMGKGPRPEVGEDIEARDDWSPYQKEFVRLIRAEVERITDTWNGPEHKRKPAERKGKTFESFSAHAAARCKRRIEKQFLAELYGAWRKAN